MKGILFLGLSVAMFLSACEEEPPFVDFSTPVQSKDTTYITGNVPVAQHKAVLIEDVTGVRCNNCPRAAQKVKDIIAIKTEDSVVAMALYSFQHNQTLTFPYPGFPDLNSTYSSQLIDALGSPAGLPSGYVDRAKYGVQTVRYNSDAVWENLVNQRLRLKTPVNIELQRTLNANKLTVKLKLTYTEAVSANYKLSLYLTENGIVSRQLTTSGEQDNYVHNHVLRHSLLNANGLPLTASSVAGRVYEKEIDYEIPSSYIPANCHLVCVISDVDNEEVVNVRQIDLK